ncbi:STAS domain-containing protein [Actinomadura kijaniata]|uniref:STAS domain-containing protein n=1 Tax=Actinomadura kijaniata TaxID=46161 RepID=UPI000B1C0D3D|nr:STAS domain-containing protein [Actinomadura kijaniata]
MGVQGPTLRTRSVRRGGWLVIEVAGELDIATAPILEDELSQATTPVTGRVAVTWVALELSGLSFADSSGLNVLIRWWKRLQAGGGNLLLLHPTGRVASLLAITGLDRFLPVHDSLPAASATPGTDDMPHARPGSEPDAPTAVVG